MSGPVGIIGGMGPAASEFFYKNVIEHTKAERDQEHVDMIILNDVSMPDRTEAILSGDYEPVYSRLLSDARMLSDCGCSAIAIICNTAHYFADMLEGQIDIPILHMINGTVDAIELSLKYRAASCSHVVLGCTELSVIREQEQLPGLYIDPMQILVKRVIEFSGKCYKP